MVTDLRKSTARSCKDPVLFLREVASASPRSLSDSAGDTTLLLASSECLSSAEIRVDLPVDVTILRIDGFSYVFRSHLGALGEDARAFLDSGSSDDVDGFGSMFLVV